MNKVQCPVCKGWSMESFPMNEEQKKEELENTLVEHLEKHEDGYNTMSDEEREEYDKRFFERMDDLCFVALCSYCGAWCNNIDKKVPYFWILPEMVNIVIDTLSHFKREPFEEISKNSRETFGGR